MLKIERYIYNKYSVIKFDLNNLSQNEINRIIEMAWEDRTPFSNIKKQYGLLEKDVIKLMKNSLQRKSFIKWRIRVRGRKTKIDNISDRFKSSNQKN